MEKVKDYALKNYPKLFAIKRIRRDSKGKIAATTIEQFDPTVIDGGSHWRVYAHLDSSPLILSKNI